MYKDIICFFCFLLEPKMYRWVEYRVSKMAELRTQGHRFKSSVKTTIFLLFESKSPRLCNISDALVNYHCHISCLTLKRCTQTRPLLACLSSKFSWLPLQTATYTRRVILLPSSMPPTQFMRHFRREHLRFLDFRYVLNFLLFSPVYDIRYCIGRCERDLQFTIQYR